MDLFFLTDSLETQHSYGTYGEAMRRKYRQDQYPATGQFGEFTGDKWRDLFAFDGTLDEDAVDVMLHTASTHAISARPAQLDSLGDDVSISCATVWSDESVDIYRSWASCL